jgi:hypothetical protein
MNTILFALSGAIAQSKGSFAAIWRFDYVLRLSLSEETRKFFLSMNGAILAGEIHA